MENVEEFDPVVAAVLAAHNAVDTGTSLGPDSIKHLLEYIDDLELELVNEGLSRCVIDYEGLTK